MKKKIVSARRSLIKKPYKLHICKHMYLTVVLAKSKKAGLTRESSKFIGLYLNSMTSAALSVSVHVGNTQIYSVAWSPVFHNYETIRLIK